MITLPGALSPSQPLTPPDLSGLSDKLPLGNNGAFSPSGGMTSIDFGQNGSSGTDLNALFGQNGDAAQETLNNEIAQTLAQLISALLTSLMPLLQQLTGQQNQQQSGQPTSGGGGGIPQNLAAGGDPTQLSGGSGAGQSAPAPASAPVGEMANTSGQSGAPAGTAATGGSGQSVTQSGGSGLHLPEALKPYEGAIQNAAAKTGVPGEVLAAQIWQESRGSLGASTVNGGNGLQDSGLMQVNSNTFADLQRKNPDLLGPNANANNPQDNIMAGALYMKEQLNDFGGNMGAALRAYNSGPLNVNVNNLNDISKTGTGDATYVDKVMNFASIISSGQGQLPA
ncbi:lytic transglycosylase domain-containing protein [Mixta hanseatica]|uniref:Lytic transglycosylase domain-containing protein n=1 Tax=Mixta hanseatica TaxID=2872648 RepID=A0ABY4R9A3_9GAMM|nr:transglycosylase SLT domain-containing protein [Mixta hanseatica]UQY44699.1 lytic transglycosylase domain-containing protein [Mixta hanseatica]